VQQVPWARDLTRRVLAEPLPRRWAHCQGVGRKAESVAHLVGDDAEALICAAWLHDVGYAPAITATGLHSLDGARYLRDAHDADKLVCRLVAYHSCAEIEAGNRGMADALAAEFPPVDGLLSDAMTYADMTTSPDGDPVDVETRLAEILTRYPPDDVVHRSIAAASAAITQAVRRIEARLAGN
jgi:predicted hydrolase (HD superfamily)